MSKYRVVQRREHSFEPQIRRWWWPFWCCLYSVCETGPSICAFRTATLEEAEKACREHANPAPVEPDVIHKVSI